ncbi:YaeQ protein [Citrifermentans bremense]|uniref:YaeQ protein n=1 Tax=Citrifermentans bremense TaxID=60035 RepID=A0A6S6M1R4_9BACT|nr:YaeQ family protein [Citrifermentans bremense]BCG47430.1 YaeQ protein [Citrifermentans bremense]
MALPSTIYRASVQLSDLDRQIYEQLQTTVAQHPSETAERLLARLLAYALCFREELVFTKGVGSGDEPDLWSKGPDGRVQLWIEVGLPDPEKLAKSCRHVERAILFAFGSGLNRWLPQHQAKLASIPNLTVIGLDFGFLSQLAENLQRVISWSLTVTEGNLYLTAGNQTMESALQQVSGPPL